MSIASFQVISTAALTLYRGLATGQLPELEVGAALYAVLGSATALKGTRPVFFPDEGKTLQTRVWDRYALEPGVSIEGPAVFEENESTFIVGPNATARLLADGSILAEAN